jgi:allantoinase
MSSTRILYQMANQRPALPPMQGRPLMVHIVVNIENWRFDHPMPRKILPAPHGVEKVPDVPNYSWAEYGMRCGLPRIMAILAERNLPASASINAGVIDAYPACAEAILDAGWEFIGHGIHQQAIRDHDDEETLIHVALEKIESFTGQRPRGWLGPGLQESFHTPDLLKKARIDYVCDWVLDDLPCWMKTEHGPLIVMPYSLEINDSVIYAVEKHSSPEMYQRVRDTLEIFDHEVKRQPRVLTIALHPHLIGVAHRIGYLIKMLDLLQARTDTTFTRGSEIADWFMKVDSGHDA